MKSSLRHRQSYPTLWPTIFSRILKQVVLVLWLDFKKCLFFKRVPEIQNLNRKEHFWLSAPVLKELIPINSHVDLDRLCCLKRTAILEAISQKQQQFR